MSFATDTASRGRGFPEVFGLEHLARILNEWSYMSCVRTACVRITTVVYRGTDEPISLDSY